MKSQKKKLRWGQMLAFIGMLAAGGAMGYGIAEWADAQAYGDLRRMMLMMAVGLIGLYLALFAQTVLHEAGHLVGGLMTGYRFVSFRVGSVMWERGADGKIRRSRFSLAGTGGQCLLAPPDMTDGRLPYVIYNLGGCLMNLLTAAVFAALALALPQAALVQPLCWSMALVGVLYALLNGIPMRMGGVDNDGRNNLLIGRSAEARRAMWLMMKVNEQQAHGIRLKDMPDEWFVPYPEETRDNAMVIAMEVAAANRLMDAQRYAEAEAALRGLMARGEKVPGVYRSMMTADLATLEALAGRPGDMAEAMKLPEMAKFIKAMKDHPSLLRAQYAMALLCDKDEQAAAALLARFDRTAARYPHPCEIESERELLAEVKELSAT